MSKQKQHITKNDIICSILMNNTMLPRDLDKIANILNYDMQSKNIVNVWTDGSYNINYKNRNRGQGGIGFIIERNGEKIYFGKKVNTVNSTDTEIMSLAVALSYILDTFKDITTDTIIKIHYDASIICEKLPDVILGKQSKSPYTNLKSALKRYRKYKVNIQFKHVKAHDKDMNNNIADAISKYYSGIELTNKQRQLINKTIKE